MRAKPNEQTKAKSQCFRCNGSGVICNYCGEAEGACACDEPDPEAEQWGDCPDCEGTGN